MKYLFAVFVFLCLPCFAHAEGDITYAAQYYSPPAGRGGKSYSHLYRINPDGTGKHQVTSGPYNDHNPRWSTDGKSIAFLREAQGDKEDLCVVSAEGGRVRVLLRGLVGSPGLRWMKQPNRLLVLAGNGDTANETVILDTATGKVLTRWKSAEVVALSPSLTYLLVAPETAKAQIVEVATGKVTTLDRPCKSGVWLDDTTLAVSIEDVDKPYSIALLDSRGKVQKTFVPQPTGEAKAELAQGIADGFHSYPFRLAALPGDDKHLLIGSVAGGSTEGHWWTYYRVDLATGTLSVWGEAGVMAWSPDGSHFCETLSRELTDYGRGGKTVWVRPLLLARRDAPAKTRPLVNGLVLVTGYDWFSKSR